MEGPGAVLTHRPPDRWNRSNQIGAGWRLAGFAQVPGAAGDIEQFFAHEIGNCGNAVVTDSCARGDVVIEGGEQAGCLLHAP